MRKEQVKKKNEEKKRIERPAVRVIMLDNEYSSW